MKVSTEIKVQIFWKKVEMSNQNCNLLGLLCSSFLWEV